MQLKSTRQTVSRHQRQTTVQLSNLVAMEDPFSVLSEVIKTVSFLDPGFDTNILENVFQDIVKLFSGRYPGYRKCRAAVLCTDLNVPIASIAFLTQSNERMQGRLAHDLDGVDLYLADHFKTRWGVEKNLYQESINNNLSKLKLFLKA